MKLTESVLRNMIRQEIKKSLNEAQSSLLNDIVARLNSYADRLSEKARQGATKPDAEDEAELAAIKQMVTDGLKAGSFSPEEFASAFPPPRSTYRPVGSGGSKFGARKV